ncbi:MAG: glycosyltransferase family 39 protein, partial [Patulibacter sp.]|nr:glycosyltransferase family 39 protein [Patulibacter sp.]
MWEKVGFGAILVLAAFLTLWGLSRNGYSNEYYAAAVKSASISWKALFFGSLDPSSFITVDKPPLSIWLMGISTRVFGFSSFAMLMPQALCTVGAVALLHATVKRVAGAPAAIAAALALALTPITIAIARVNNPDALMILLMVGAGYLLVRALESGKTKFLAWCGVLVGLAFMTKMLQGWMVLPAFAITYFAFGPGTLGRRTWQLLVAAVTTTVVSAAWPTAVSLWPGSKPFIGGSTDGSAWNLIFGYNGLGRITGNESGMGGGGGSPTFGGTAGWLRMFNDQVGAQIAWLLPLAGLSLIAGLWMTRKAPRTDLRRAGIAMFGLWLVVHFAIFSTQEGIFHPYYTSAMAPAIAALCGIGVVMLFRAARRSWLALIVLDLAVAGTALLSLDLMGRATDAPGWAKIAVPVGAVVGIALSPVLRSEKPSLRRLVAIAAVAGSIGILAGPASYSFANLGRSLNGNNVLAGPAGASSGGFGGGGAGGGMRGGFGGGTPPSGAQGGT